MKSFANRFSVVLDANVLFPFLTRDLLLSCAAEGLFRPRWTKLINQEWSRAAVSSGRISREQANRTLSVMNTHFDEAEIEGYEPLIDGLALPDPDDRHVLAAAIRIKADMIVTDNIKDFPAETLDGFEIEACTADKFLANTIDLFKIDAVRAIREARNRCVNPPIGRDEYLHKMIASGLVETANEIKPYFEDL